jgi:diguanylate cyclase (GGDEF)-like protein
VLKVLLRILVVASLALPLTARATTLRVVGDNNYPPYLFLGPDGKPRGYVVDAWQLWEKKTGIKVELTATDWADAQQRLLHGRADVIEMIFKTPEREALYDFSVPFTRVTAGIYSDAGITGINDASSLKGFQVGVERGDACVDRLHDDGINNVRTFAGYADLIAAATRREIRIFCVDEYPADYYLYRLGGSNHFTKAFDYYSGEFRRGVRKGDTATLAIVQRGMALITDDELAALHRKWMGQPVDFNPYARIFGYGLLTGTLAGIALLIWIYTLRRAVERRTRDLDFLAYHDPLTGLPNRRLLIDRLHHAIAQHAGAKLATLLINLDDFNRVNESFGHPVGDQLLRAVAERLLSCTPAANTVARLGGDEFALMLSGHADPTAASAAAARILNALAQPFTLNGTDLFVGASIGVSIYPDDGNDGVTLLKNAAAAMYRAKQSGRNAFGFYSASLTEQASHLLQLGTSLRRALEREEFVLVYQPQVHVPSGQIIGVEALVRWQNGSDLVLPAQFIPFAEETGLIEPIGRWVLHTACQQLAAWLAAGLPPVRMAVNLSPRQLASVDLVKQVQAALKASQIPPQLLDLEITESALMVHGAAATEILMALRELGIGLAIDDFGTGYSSLAYLRHFPVELLKIDQSFMRGVPEEAGAVEVASAIVVMAHTLHMQVIAEGVENLQQWTFLQNIGCDYAQGWYLGMPMSAAEMEVVLRANILPTQGVAYESMVEVDISSQGPGP